LRFRTRNPKKSEKSGTLGAHCGKLGKGPLAITVNDEEKRCEEALSEGPQDSGENNRPGAYGPGGAKKALAGKKKRTTVRKMEGAKPNLNPQRSPVPKGGFD